MFRSGSETIVRIRSVLGWVPAGAPVRQERQWDTASQLQITGVAFMPLSTTEYIDDREFAETHWKCIVMGAADIQNTDRVQWLTDPDPSLDAPSEWEVQGAPEFWNDMRGRQHHTTFLLKQWVEGR